jgi:AcrR family transcriptional regulator
MRSEILYVATERFGRDGYETTRWADIAGDVGLGATALYHYFESKQHCLFVILQLALHDYLGRFDRIIADNSRFEDAIRAILRNTFELDHHAVLRNQLLVAESGLLATPRPSPREDLARRSARESISALERAWAIFLTRGMELGLVREADPQLLGRAILGLYNSIWHWYRVGGVLGLEDLSAFFVEHGLAMAGCARLSEPRSNR